MDGSRTMLVTPVFIGQSALRAYVNKQKAAVVGKSGMSLSVSVADCPAATTVFWQKLADAFNADLKATGHKLVAKVLEKQGIEFQAQAPGDWRAYEITAPYDANTTRLDKAQIRTSTDDLFWHRTGSSSGIIRFKADENCPWHCMMLLYNMMQKKAVFDTVIVRTDGYPCSDDYVWVAPHMWP